MWEFAEAIARARRGGARARHAGGLGQRLASTTRPRAARSIRRRRSRWSGCSSAWRAPRGLALRRRRAARSCCSARRREELGGSEWLALRRGLEAGAAAARSISSTSGACTRLLARGACAKASLRDRARRLGAAASRWRSRECCFAGRGARSAREVRARATALRPDALLFGESTGPGDRRPRADAEALLARGARGRASRRARSARTGGARLRIGGRGAPPWIDAPRRAPARDLRARAPAPPRGGDELRRSRPASRERARGARGARAARATASTTSAASSASTATPRPRTITYLGLYALQHRGQESAGIVLEHGGEQFVHRGMGLVADVFNEKILARLPGRHAIGHVRYSTTRREPLRNAQPFCANTDARPGRDRAQRQPGERARDPPRARGARLDLQHHHRQRGDRAPAGALARGDRSRSG